MTDTTTRTIFDWTVLTPDELRQIDGGLSEADALAIEFDTESAGTLIPVKVKHNV